jgi:hypothetical protein
MSSRSNHTNRQPRLPGIHGTPSTIGPGETPVMSGRNGHSTVVIEGITLPLPVVTPGTRFSLTMNDIITSRTRRSRAQRIADEPTNKDSVVWVGAYSTLQLPDWHTLLYDDVYGPLETQQIELSDRYSARSSEIAAAAAEAAAKAAAAVAAGTPPTMIPGVAALLKENPGLLSPSSSASKSRKPPRASPTKKKAGGGKLKSPQRTSPTKSKTSSPKSPKR